ncbi:MAG: deoxyribonuclease IV [Chloroflexota bacterium]
MQIFLSSPQRWVAPKHTDEQVAEYGRLMADSVIEPTFAHASYLVNLASVDEGIRLRSIDSLSASLEWADRVGIEGLVVHVGSGRGQTIPEAEVAVAGALAKVLSASDGGRARVLLENSAGSGELLGSRFAQIGDVFRRLDGHPRLALCLDTAHTFASGYDLRVAEGIQRAVEEIEREIGLARLLLIHANDSKVGLGSAVDRHENIGRGQIGEAAFEMLLAHPALRDVAWVLEVPGYEDKGPDKRNLDDLKRLAGRTLSAST